MNRVFSIIIPTVGRVALLKKAIESVLSNTYKYIEILVINDNKESAADVRTLVDHFDDPRVVFYNNIKKKGGNGARNTGILRSKGEIIAFLDEDDEYLTGRLEKVSSVIRNSPDDIGGCLTGFEYWNGMELLKYPEILGGDITRKILVENYNFGNSSNFIFMKIKHLWR